MEQRWGQQVQRLEESGALRPWLLLPSSARCTWLSVSASPPPLLPPTWLPWHAMRFQRIGCSLRYRSGEAIEQSSAQSHSETFRFLMNSVFSVDAVPLPELSLEPE